MLRRLIAYCRTASFWGGVLMFLGLGYVILILGFFQPLLISHLSNLYAYDGFEDRAAQSVEAHRRVRQAIFCWYHDDGIALSFSGTKEDVPRLLDVEDDASFVSCSGAHRDSAMESITNHHAGSSLSDWKAWWETHSHQTQAQWIMNGFKAKGIEFSLPPDHATCLRLLRLIGRDANEQKREDRFKENPERTLPDYMILNLHRVLRYHDFDGTKVTKEDIAADPSGEVFDGLKALMWSRGKHGFLFNPFETDEAKRSSSQPSGSLHPMTIWIHTLIAFLLFQSGFFLWLRARFRRASATAVMASGNAPGSDQTSTPVSP